MPAPATVTDTIAAISTPPGRGGIGIVRLSGPQAASIAVQLVRLRHPLEHAQTRLADVLDGADENPARDEATRIDEALVTFFAAPNSYTAEDLVEIAAHGSPVVLELLLRRALALGARLAEPGEFTQRAFLSGRLDLTQAEAVRDLIDAQTLTQARQAASQMGGALSHRVAPIKQSLVELVALLEAGIDFAEDDLDVTPQQEISRRIAELTPPLAALEASFARGRIVHDGLTLAIVGRPNAGKSSLFNRLVERDRAIVTATPGTTRDLVTERISIGGIPIELVDTAGLREGLHANIDEIELLGIHRSREALADAALVLIVLDATQPLNDEEHRLLAAVESRPAIVAVNKSDLAELARSENLGAPGPSHLGTGDTRNAGSTYSPTAVSTSALTGEGLPALREKILALATGGAAAEPGMLTNLRQHQAVTTALAALADAAAANAAAIPHEMILLDLYRALWALDSLTGQTTPDDILNLIFSTFCIGK
ncbi:MAG: tRNA uridine-5-carboxymethylaminomethyl(34) synthesis GTPase MnmE [Terracidiphilus sp.]|nr:tRNA uridine-5-carboxymethylaminomethyl(34) synthesis GTPase MnmE [Terracidiphilus sp.]